MTPFQARILAAIRSAGPGGIESSLLWERFYGSGDHRCTITDRMPARTALKATIHNVNRNLAGAGRIVGQRGGRGGGVYRFERGR